MSPVPRRTALGSALLLPGAAMARVNAERGIALRGTDVVAYFTKGRPRQGLAAHAFAWNSARWLFATAAHRDAFAADPARYAPTCGGFCSWAMSQGDTAPADPNA